MLTEAMRSRVQEGLAAALRHFRGAEYPYTEWIATTLSNPKITSFEFLVANPASLWELALRADLPLDKTLAKSKQTLRLFVDSIEGLWAKHWQTGFFELYARAHREEIPGDFNFQRNFEEVQFSNPQLVFATLVSSVVVTTIVLNPKLKNSAVFESICSLSAESQMFLAEHFMELENLAQDVADHLNSGLQLHKQQSLRETTDAFKLMDKLARKKEKVRQLKFANAALAARVAELEGTAKEQEFKLQQLNFSKTDLVNRFKSCSLVFETEEIRAREEQIEELRRLIEGKECVYKKSVLDFEKNQEELYKRIQVLENFRAKYQNVAEKEGRLSELQEKVQAVLSENSVLKDKCDALRQKMKDMERENEKLLLRSEVFDRSSAKQIATDMKSQISLDLKPEKHTREFAEKGQNILGEFVDELLALVVPEKQVLRELKENAAESQNTRAAPREGQKELVTRLRGATLRFNENFGAFLGGISGLIEQQTRKASDADSFKAKARHRITKLEERIKELEGQLVENLRIQDPRIQSLCDTLKAPANFNETSKTMLNAILNRELEISTLKQARRAALSEFLNVETKFAEQTKLMYAISVAYLAGHD